MTTPHPHHPLLDRLWTSYVARVPFAARFAGLAGSFENDHIALRTLDRPGSGLDLFVNVFERLGWRPRDTYAFPDAHLKAVYLSQDGLPRVFVSTLDIQAFPVTVRETLEQHPPDQAAPDGSNPDQLAAWFCAPARRPARAAWEHVMQHTQYGGWVLLFGRMVNHFTARVDDVEAWQRRLLGAGVPMKDEIEGAALAPGAAGLRQTATHAANVDVTLGDGATVNTPYAYFEIAQRQGGFDGFLTPQARQLFEMTRPR